MALEEEIAAPLGEVRTDSFDSRLQRQRQRLAGYIHGEKVTELVQTEAFRAVTGPGANSKEKLRIRIQLATDALLSAV